MFIYLAKLGASYPRISNEKHKWQPPEKGSAIEVLKFEEVPKPEVRLHGLVSAKVMYLGSVVITTLCYEPHPDFSSRTSESSTGNKPCSPGTSLLAPVTRQALPTVNLALHKGPFLAPICAWKATPRPSALCGWSTLPCGSRGTSSPACPPDAPSQPMARAGQV